MPSAPHLDFAGRVRSATALAVLHASKVDDVATARHAIREGKVDLVGMTRAHLADPHIVRKIIAGAEAEIRPCVGATYCLDRIYDVRRGAVHPQRGDEPGGDDAPRDPAGADAAPRRGGRRRPGRAGGRAGGRASAATR